MHMVDGIDDHLTWTTLHLLIKAMLIQSKTLLPCNTCHMESHPLQPNLSSPLLYISIYLKPRYKPYFYLLCKNTTSDMQNQRGKRRRREKSDAITLLPKEATVLGVLPSTENPNFVSAKSVPTNSLRSAAPPCDDATMKIIGRPVTGVVDGAFDAGFVVSVRIGGSDSIFRGVVFRPGMIVPPFIPPPPVFNHHQQQQQQQPTNPNLASGSAGKQVI